MTQTEHYELRQWECWEPVTRAGVNGVTAEIDAALAGLNGSKAEIVTGSYTGDKASTRAIHLGFRAKAVLVVSYGGLNDGSLDHMLVQLALDGLPSEQVEITDAGFTVQYRLNESSWGAYHYLAVR